MTTALLQLCKSDLGTGAKIELLEAVFTAHMKSAMNNNCISNQAARLAAAGSNDFCKSVVCAVSTLGGRHGALSQARKLYFQNGNEFIKDIISQGELIPGFGNSFFKQSIDPAWEVVAYLLKTKYHAWHEKLAMITEEFSKQNKRLYPNPAGFTAVVSELLGIDEGLEILLLIHARLPVWGQIFAETKAGQKEVYE